MLEVQTHTSKTLFGFWKILRKSLVKFLQVFMEVSWKLSWINPWKHSWENLRENSWCNSWRNPWKESWSYFREKCDGILKVILGKNRGGNCFRSTCENICVISWKYFCKSFWKKFFFRKSWLPGEIACVITERTFKWISMILFSKEYLETPFSKFWEHYWNHYSKNP